MSQPPSPSERLKDLRAAAMEHVEPPVLWGFAGVVCDRCGTVKYLDPEHADEQMENWGIGPEGDICPECVKAGSNG